MDLNNKQLSFIITFCVMGILVLTAYNIKLRDKQEDEYLYELSFDEEILEEEIPEEMPQEMTELETHMAYNEAAESRFAQELEEFKTLEELQQEIEAQQQLAEEAGEEGEQSSENLDLAKEFLEELKKKKELMAQLEKEEKTPPANIKRKTTITYSLKDRFKLEIPNPIYTCESFGKVVINIEVNALGTVTSAKFNEKSSTTSNGCLVENALEYAEQARFNPDPAKGIQKGSITYLFQGE